MKNLPRVKITKEHSAKIRRLHEDGWMLDNIALEVGLSRKQVQHHLWWLNMSPEQKEKRRGRINELRRKRDSAERAHIVGGAGTVTSRPPAHVLADRDLRASRPFILRCDVLGEPEPGRSALDRKLAEARA